MTPDNLSEQADQICELAMELSAVQRKALLNLVCAGNDALRQIVRHQLACQIWDRIKYASFEQQESLMANACGDDEELRRIVMELLNVEGPDLWFLDHQDENEAIADSSPIEKICSRCKGKKYSVTLRRCPEHNELLSLPDHYDLTGGTVDGYRIDAVIGVGGFGIVYAAYQFGTKRQVAFKILSPTLVLLEPRAASRFNQEAQIVARLNHPNIVTIYTTGEVNRHPPLQYIVMEWVEGLTLQEIIRTRGRLEYKHAANILRQICNALDEAHSKNIVHLDLKPSNIMLTQRIDGEVVKVLDFGIAKVISGDSRSTTSVIGMSPIYASPEQVRREKDIDHRSDIYSLGVIL